MAPLGEALDPSKLIISILFDAFWVCGVHGNILTRIVSNSHFWKRLGAGDMTIVGFHVGSHIPNIGNLEVHGVYAGIWRYIDVYGRNWRHRGLNGGCRL